MPTTYQNNPATLTVKDDGAKLVCAGAWNAAGIVKLQERLPRIHRVGELIIDGSDIQVMDSAGAWLIQRLVMDLEKQNIKVQLVHFSSEHQSLLKMTAKQAPEIVSLPPESSNPNLFYFIGEEVVVKYSNTLNFFAFFGELFVNFIQVILRPRLLQIRAVLNTIEHGGFYALPIIGLLSFLIGVVLAYQIGLQLVDYGANVFIVNMIGFSMFREFAPLITAIILAGRTGAAFTAQIGMMKVNEEIDALYVMGLSPINRLVLPKFLGLLIALPLLSWWSACFGVFGGMVIAKYMFSIGYYDFIHRFQEVIQAKAFWVGISKVPVFAIIISTVGCFRGFQVSGSADSVGWETTKSVVQAIFFIIVADAAFSIVYGWLDI